MSQNIGWENKRKFSTINRWNGCENYETLTKAKKTNLKTKKHVFAQIFMF